MAWKRWLAAHAADLADCGIPAEVMSSEHRWLRFLEESGDLATGWSLAMLSPVQALALHDFIAAVYGLAQHRTILGDLRRVIDTGAA